MSGKPSAGREYSAFVSHASADREAAETIVAALEAKGLTCWVAPRDVRPGAEYPTEILRGIESSKCFILVLSSAANRSAHVRREVERAASKGKAIYPVRIENVPPSAQLEYFVAMHHWLDAWDAVLSERAGELAAAIQSEEEWIGNKVLKRRRRRFIGAGAGAALGVAALIVALVFAPDLRRTVQSDRDRAIADLGSRGISVSTDSAAKALSVAAIDDLRLLQRAGASSLQLRDAMLASGPAFFENSRANAPAIQWLREALEGWLDPNLPLPHDHYGREAIIAAALRAGNADAVLALLAAGASPHAYQDVWLSPYSVPRILFPHTYVIGHDRLSVEQKKEILHAYAKAGAVFMTIDGSGPERNNEQTISLQRVRNSIAGLTGEPPSETSSACAAPRPLSRCKAMTARSTVDWCRIIGDMPARVFSASDSGGRDLFPFVVHDILTVAEDKAYVLATESFMRDYMLIEVGADGRRWRIFKYTPPMVGKGHCKDGTRGGRNDRCWRAWSGEYDRERQLLKIDGYSDYRAVPDC